MGWFNIQPPTSKFVYRPMRDLKLKMDFQLFFFLSWVKWCEKISIEITLPETNSKRPWK